MLNKLSLLYLCWCIIPLAVHAQQKTPVFRAETDAKEILLNSYLEVDFVLENGQGSNFKAPKFQNAKVISGPSTSSSTTIVNGQVSQSISYGFMLQPTKVGTIVISSASVRVTGKTLRTKPMRVKVVKGKDKLSNKNNIPDEDSFFIRAEPSTAAAKIGQQILLDYKLYTLISIESYNVLSESDYQGFYAQEIQRYNSKTQRETINGKQYTTKILKRVALFPQQAGKLTISSMNLQVGINKGNPQRRNSFFFNRNIQRMPYKTEAIDINVSPLPSDAPLSFSGAVGTYKADVTTNRTALTTDNDLAIRLTISGDGDLKRIQAPDIGLSADSFEVYDPIKFAVQFWRQQYSVLL